MAIIQITPALAIDDRHISEHFVHGSGPGGQNVNKVASSVELRFDVRSSSLPDDVKDRLIKLAGHRAVGGGAILIDSHEHRTQGLNREAALERLAVLIRKAAQRPRKRRKTRPPAVAREKRIESKKRRGALKASRGRTPSE